MLLHRDPIYGPWMDRNDIPTSPFTLLEAIRRFDRRERRAVIGMLGGANAPRLCDQAAETLAEKLNHPAADLRGAPWFMDYTWNWLVAAVAVFSAQSFDLEKIHENDGGLIENNQEDVDALIVAGNHLVLIEAKWHGPWDNRQLGRKARRIAAFADFLAKADPSGTITWQLALASRIDPATETAAKDLEGLINDCPSKGLRAVSVVPLSLRCFFGELPSNLFEVPYVQKKFPWRIARSRGWESPSTNEALPGSESR